MNQTPEKRSVCRRLVGNDFLREQKDDKAREPLAFFSGRVPQINGQVFRYKRTD
jgi:hypothetical protein